MTGASINTGHHIYAWDLKDYKNNTVQAGEYTIRIETAFWPSMEYQSVSSNILIGEKDTEVVVEEGNLIPYVELRYYSEVKDI